MVITVVVITFIVWLTVFTKTEFALARFAPSSTVALGATATAILRIVPVVDALALAAGQAPKASAAAAPTVHHIGTGIHTLP